MFFGLRILTETFPILYLLYKVYTMCKVVLKYIAIWAIAVTALGKFYFRLGEILEICTFSASTVSYAPLSPHF